MEAVPRALRHQLFFAGFCPSRSAESREKRQEHQKRLSGVADELQSQATASDVVIFHKSAKVWNRRAVIIPLPLRGRWRTAFSRPRCEDLTTPSQKRPSQALVLKALQQADFSAIQTKSGKNPFSFLKLNVARPSSNISCAPTAAVTACLQGDEGHCRCWQLSALVLW